VMVTLRLTMPVGCFVPGSSSAIEPRCAGGHSVAGDR